MLEDLRIKDFALIDNASVEFSDGFTVLSGETGAGKSLLIGALSFLLGGKGGTEQIRTGCPMAEVSGTFYIKDLSKNLENAKPLSEGEEAQSPAQWLFEHGITAENDRILLRRIIRENGKSSAWIDDTPVTRADLASFSAFLVDIHGQHEHQSLMRVSEHRKFLDSFAGINDKVAEFTKLYSILVEKRKSLDAMQTDESTRAQKIEILTFAIKEIEEAKLKQNEDIELEKEEIKLSSYERLYSDIETVNSALDGFEGGGALSSLKKIRTTAQHSVEFDKSLEKLNSRLENVYYELEDIAGEYKSYFNSLVFDPERLVFVQDRLALLFNLKKKYASSQTAPLSEVFKFAEDAAKRLEELSGSQKNKDSLEAEIREIEKKVYMQAKEISAHRKTAARKMAEEVMKILSSLGMNQTVFCVEVSEKSGTEVEQKCGPYGMDNIEFLISANPGNPPQSLAKIASGGELSRVMLALKTVLAASDTVGTMIFDEIDTGIGGEVALSVGKHLKNLAKDRQVLCITHLASIASFAHNQLKIEKSVTDGKASTNIYHIEGQKRVEEIARMLSGDSVSQTSLEHAKSMLFNLSGE